MESEFRVTIHPKTQATVLALSGELDLASFPRLEHAIDRVLEAADVPELVVLDLSELQFMDVAGLRSVLRSDQRIRGAGARLLVASARPGVVRLLSLTRQDQALQLVDSVPDGFSDLR